MKSRELFSEEQIRLRVQELGKQITEDYKGKSPLFVCILKGAFIFMSDLVREVDLDLEVDFMVVSSYGSSTKSSGVVKVVLDLAKNIEGKDVIIVEDVIDTSLTITYLRDLLSRRNPNSLRVCSMLLKEEVPEQRNEDLLCEYYGFKIPPDFVIGYGLDLDQKYRNYKNIVEYLES